MLRALAILVLLAIPVGVRAQTPGTPPMPKTETDFLYAIAEARETYDAQPNELKKSVVLTKMTTRWKTDNPNAVFKGWIGRVVQMKTNTEGKAIFGVEIAPHVVLETWNNMLSDVEDGTMISQNSPLFATIAELAEGQPVIFDAQIKRFANLTERGKIYDTEIAVKFTAVHPAN